MYCLVSHIGREITTGYDAHWIVFVAKIAVYGCLYYSQRVGLVDCTIISSLFQRKTCLRGRQEFLNSMNVNVSGLTPFNQCCHPWFGCSSDVFGGCGFSFLSEISHFSQYQRERAWVQYCCCSCSLLNKRRIFTGGKMVQ